MSNINKLLLLTLIVALLFIGISLKRKSSDKILQTKSIPVGIQLQQNKSDSQENEEGNVTVIVKPKILKAGEKPEFEVAFETHSVELDFDVSQVSKLYDDKGILLEGAAWNGSPEGGHHRSGTLSFKNPLTETKSVELVITNVSEVPERRFKWEL